MGYGQEVQITADQKTLQYLQKLAHENDPKTGLPKQTVIRFNYTLNKEEIPTPYQGQLYDSKYDQFKIILSRELLGPNIDKVELKVIGFIEGHMPSLVATKTFKLRNDISPINLQKDAHDAI